MKYLIFFLALMFSVGVFAQKPPLDKGLFAPATAGAENLKTYTWTTAMSDTLESEQIQISNPSQEIGLWGLFLKCTGSPTITVKLRYVYEPTVVSNVYNSVAGYTNGTATTVTSFVPANGFESRMDYLNEWWLYNPEGFKIVLIRDSNSEVIFTFGGIKAL